MRVIFVRVAVAALLLTSPAEAQREFTGLSPTLAIGVSAQNRDYRAILGWSARAGASGPVMQRLDWAADLSLERFGDDGGVEFAPCPADSQCVETPDAITLGHASALLVLRDNEGPSAYLLGGGGLTRVLSSGESARRTYAHATAGIGWPFARDGRGVFLELRFNKFLRAEEPMSAWSLPVLLGFRF